MTATQTTKIGFENRAGQRIAGEVVEDIGHALVVHVQHTNRRKLLGRTMVFPKNDMLGRISLTDAADAHRFMQIAS